MRAETQPVASVRHFACTQCGRCCNRSPEVELSEAAPFADDFVFQLMFRVYRLPDRIRTAEGPARVAWERQSYYQQKMLLTAFAACEISDKPVGNALPDRRFLTISALALQSRVQRCSALDNERCSIYERRPLACRSVPFHYSRGDASADCDLSAFIALPGHACDSSESAPVVLQDGKIVDVQISESRIEAAQVAKRDRLWKDLIVRRMKIQDWNRRGLPSFADVRTHSPLGVTLTSMRLGWQIALETGLLSEGAYLNLIRRQHQVMERTLQDSDLLSQARETLLEMRDEYRQEANASPINRRTFSTP